MQSKLNFVVRTGGCKKGIDGNVYLDEMATKTTTFTAIPTFSTKKSSKSPTCYVTNSKISWKFN